MLINTFAARDFASSPLLPLPSHTTTTNTATLITTTTATKIVPIRQGLQRQLGLCEPKCFFSFDNEELLKPPWCLRLQNLKKGCLPLFVASQVLAKSRPASVDSRINCASRRSKYIRFWFELGRAQYPCSLGFARDQSVRSCQEPETRYHHTNQSRYLDMMLQASKQESCSFCACAQ